MGCIPEVRKALTLWQPWATLMTLRVKWIETRPWTTNYRGRIYLHAGKRFVELGYGGELGGWLCRVSSFNGRPYLLAPGTWPGGGALDWNEKMPAPMPLPLGAVLGSAELTDCVPILGVLPTTQTRCIEANRGNAALWNEVGATVINDQVPFGDFTPGRFGWLFEGIEPLAKPVAAKGMQRLWNWTPQ